MPLGPKSKVKAILLVKGGEISGRMCGIKLGKRTVISRVTVGQAELITGRFSFPSAKSFAFLYVIQLYGTCPFFIVIVFVSLEFSFLIIFSTVDSLSPASYLPI